MNQYQRLKFYIACFFKDLKWKLCADKQIEEFEQSLVPEESVSGAEVKLIEDIIFMDEEEQKEASSGAQEDHAVYFRAQETLQFSERLVVPESDPAELPLGETARFYGVCGRPI